MEDKNPLRIAITPFDLFSQEAACIKAILDEGWDYVHLRHPGASYTDMRNLIEAVPQKYHSRLRLHGHFELTNEFNLGGLHLNGRCPAAPPNYNGSLSRTCHTLDEAHRYAPGMDFITLSPIFDSVSKEGYTSAFTAADLQRVPEGKTVALGGITPDTARRLKGTPFIGYAVLGYLFSAKTVEELKERLKQFQETV